MSNRTRGQVGVGTSARDKNEDELQSSSTREVNARTRDEQSSSIVAGRTRNESRTGRGYEAGS